MAGPPIPDIATLKSLCQDDKLRRDPRVLTRWTRAVSIHLTWIFLHAGWRPNHVTALSVLLGLAGSVALALPAPAAALAGGLLLLAYHLLDKVDGDIARFRKVYSIVGVYLDELGHGVTLAGSYLGLGLHLAWGTGDAGMRLLLLGAAGVGAVAALLGRVHRNVGFLLYAQYAMTHPELLPGAPAPAGWGTLTRSATHAARERSGALGMLERLRDAALQLGDFAVLVLALVAGAWFEVAFRSSAVLFWTLFAGAALQTALLAALVAVNASANVVSEVNRLERIRRGAGGGEDGS